MEHIEERYRALTEEGQDVISEITPDAHILYVSPSFTATFGWEPGEVLGKNAFDLIHPDDRREVDEIRALAMAEERSARLFFRLRHKNGSWRWVELSGRPYRTSSGELRAVLVTRDVTDRVETAQTLQQQLEIERHIGELARRFLALGADDAATAIERGLAEAGAVARADRVQLFAMEVDAVGIGGYHQWCDAGVEPRDPGDLERAIETYRWSANRLMRGELIHLRTLADLPDEAVAERESLAAGGVRSYLAIPIHYDGRAAGFLDFFRLAGSAHPDGGWDDQEITRLRLISEVFASAWRRSRIEERRRASEGRLEALATHARDVICEMSGSGNLLYASPNVSELCGWTVAELRRTDLMSLVHPDDRASIGSIDDLWLGPRRMAPQLRYRVRHRDGGWRWLETTARSFVAPAGDRRTALVIRDVTDREERRLELERQLDVEKAIAEFTKEILVHGSDEIDITIEHGLRAAAKIAGADRSFLVSTLGTADAGTSSFDWNAPDVPPREHRLGMRDRRRQAWVARQLAERRVVQIPRVSDLPEDARFVREDLERYGIRSFLAIPVQADGEPLGVLGFHCMRGEKEWSEHEITLLRIVGEFFTSALRRRCVEERLEQSRRQLVQAQKMEAIGTLAGGIAHDFNNQLTVMLGNARHVLRHVQDDEDLKEALTDLHRAAEHCAQLTRSLLAFSRRTSLSVHALDVGEVIAGVTDLLRPLMPKSIDFSVAAPGDVDRVRADATQLQQVLVNLAVNARDALPDGGRIEIRARNRRLAAPECESVGLAAGDYVELSVDDTGTGMDSDTQERMFEPFFTTKPQGQGTGLGLATAYGIVRECGGAILVQSKVGKGSKFQILLPSEDEEAIPESPPTAEDTSSLRGTVLLVEDADGVRRLIERVLRGVGFRVIEAADGSSALRAAETADRIDVLVTDVDMPGMSGVELAHRLVARRTNLPVLFISGSSLVPLDAPDSPVPVARFLQKPFTEEALLSELRALLESDD